MIDAWKLENQNSTEFAMMQMIRGEMGGYLDSNLLAFQPLERIHENHYHRHRNKTPS